MTVSTADLGGMGNGLGLPIANPLYGPAQAAQMGQQAWQQNMANAQATTANTQAQTGQTQELTREERLKNDVTAGLDPNLRIQAATSDLTGQLAKTESERRNLADQEYIKNAPVFDNMNPAQAEQAQMALAKKYNIDPADALNRWQGGAVAAAKSQQASLGPAQAAFQYSGGGHQANAERLLKLNPELMKTAIEQSGATERTGMQLTMEEKLAQKKMDFEAAQHQIDLKSDPQKAGQFWASKAFEAHQNGDANGEAYAIRQTQDATDRNNSIKAFQAFMQQYMLYGMMGMPGPTGATPPGVGGGGGAAPGVESGTVNGKSYTVTAPGAAPGGSPSATPNMAGLPVGGPQGQPMPQAQPPQPAQPQSDLRANFPVQGNDIDSRLNILRQELSDPRYANDQSSIRNEMSMLLNQKQQLMSQGRYNPGQTGAAGNAVAAPPQGAPQAPQGQPPQAPQQQAMSQQEAGIAARRNGYMFAQNYDLPTLKQMFMQARDLFQKNPQSQEAMVQLAAVGEAIRLKSGGR